MATSAKSTGKTTATKSAGVDVSGFKAGQELTCTIETMPRTKGQADTLARLMRLDHTNLRALRRAQRMRRQREVVYNRGNRDWVKREKTARVVSVEKGKTWTLPFNFDLAGDLAAVAKFISIKAK